MIFCLDTVSVQSNGLLLYCFKETLSVAKPDASKANVKKKTVATPVKKDKSVSPKISPSKNKLLALSNQRPDAVKTNEPVHKKVRIYEARLLNGTLSAVSRFDGFFYSVNYITVDPPLHVMYTTEINLYFIQDFKLLNVTCKVN